jgi:FMN reductase
MDIVGIAGSPASRSRSAWLLQLAHTRLEAQAGASQVLALRELPAAALIAADAAAEPIRAAIERVQRAELVIVATPI